MPLTRMQNGQMGKVMEVNGGKIVNDRLTSLGIRQGQKLTRIGGMFLNGPVTVKVDKSQVAIGYGMAGKIMVKTENENPIDG